jgi:allantoate deiminase
VQLRIDPDRLWSILDEINSFGALNNGGIDRLAWTPSEIEARQWLFDRCQRLGLETRMDEAGNVWAFAGARPAVVLGSHLDSVPHGGRFDGALGIAAALAIISTAREASLLGADRLGSICFTDEEGVRFGLGMTGSRAVAGDLTIEDVKRAATTDGLALVEVLAACGLNPERVPEASNRRADISCYLELHVEQGRRLERAGLPASIVTGIVGLSHWRIEIRGQANHAGTTLPEDRRDALIPLAAAVQRARSIMNATDGLVVTVGEAEVVGGATNIVPGRSRFSLDVRSLEKSLIDFAATEIVAETKRVGDEHGCSVEATETKRLHPAPMADRVLNAQRDASKSLDVDIPEMASMAGHDAMTLGVAGIDCGMVFVRSEGGFSHSPREASSKPDCALATELLGRTALRLAKDL